MKITSNKEYPFGQSSSNPEKSDLFATKSAKKPSRRKIKKVAGGVRLKKDGGGGKRSSRPETPLLRWKFDEGRRSDFNIDNEEEQHPPEAGRRNGRRWKGTVSSRKLAASLWRMQLPQGPTQGGENLGFQSGVGNVVVPFHGHQGCKAHISPSKDAVESPRSVSGPIKALLTKVEPSFQSSIYAMEGATKWDPIDRKESNDDEDMYSQPKIVEQQSRVAAKMASMESELEQAQARIHELQTERRSSKKKLEHFLKKLSEERAAWRSREHEKIRAIIDDVKSDLTRERKNRQRLEIVNSKLVNELADTKMSAKRYMQDYEKERRSRELIEEVCDELAKEIAEDKAEIEELRRDSMRFQEDVDEERKMLQMAEVWREERVQMKLLDAKVILEDKFSQMNKLVSDLESLLNSSSSAFGTEEMKKAEMLQQVAANLSIHEIREFTYERTNPDDMFSVFEDVNFCEPPSERQTEPCAADSPARRGSQNQNPSPEANEYNRYNSRSHPSYVYQSGELEDGSEWETVSQHEDQGSSSSLGVTNPSVNRSGRGSNLSGSGSEWEGDKHEGTPITETNEVCTIPSRQLKKVSSISRLWKSSNGKNYKIVSLEGFNGRLSNGRLSNGATHSPDHGSGKNGLSPQGLSGQWSSPDSANQHINRLMKGCIEWPRSVQKNSLKNKLLEARMESQKVQLRQVLKQKI